VAANVGLTATADTDILPLDRLVKKSKQRALVRKSWQAMLWEEQTPTDESDGGTLNVGQAGRGRGGTTTQLVALGAPH
jgi:hypothetical protein